MCELVLWVPPPFDSSLVNGRVRSLGALGCVQGAQSFGEMVSPGWRASPSGAIEQC